MECIHRVGVSTKALLLAVIDDGNTIRHEAEDHRIPQALGIDRNVRPARHIVVFKEVAK